jgi:hypothetical protein
VGPRAEFSLRGKGNRRKETVRDGNHRGGEIKSERKEVTREQTILAAMEMMKWGQSGWADGEEVQYSPKQGKGSRFWTSTDNPLWNWEHYDYRRKPAAKLRSWTADEVPLGAWIRRKDALYCGRRVLICETYDESTRSTWLVTSEHSTDGGVTWKPCGVVEEAK